MKNGKCTISVLEKVTVIGVPSSAYGDHTVLINTEDLPLVRGWCFRLMPNSRKGNKLKVMLSIGNSGVVANNILLHRLITNAEDTQVVDRINGDTLDNRRENLRVCSVQQNNENRTPGIKNSTSGIRGVSWNRRMQKWRAYASRNHKQNHLGFFDSLEEASAVSALWRRENMPFSEMDKEAA